MVACTSATCPTPTSPRNPRQSAWRMTLNPKAPGHKPRELLVVEARLLDIPIEAIERMPNYRLREVIAGWPAMVHVAGLKFAQRWAKMNFIGERKVYRKPTRMQAED